MMYSELAIQTLIDRIGWREPVQPSEIVLSPENEESTSGRFFNSFHTTATVENVFACISNLDVDNDGLNEFLEEMKRDTVLEVLNKIFDTNIRAKYQFNAGIRSINFAPEYSDFIIANQSVFEESIGYSMVVRCFQLFISTIRSNENESAISMSFELLKSELEGMKNEYGKTIAIGHRAVYGIKISEAINILFPEENTNVPKLYGRRPW